eukprot:3941876-Rhodomonas_salina.2
MPGSLSILSVHLFFSSPSLLPSRPPFLRPFLSLFPGWPRSAAALPPRGHCEQPCTQESCHTQHTHAPPVTAAPFMACTSLQTSACAISEPHVARSPVLTCRCYAMYRTDRVYAAMQSLVLQYRTTVLRTRLSGVSGVGWYDVRCKVEGRGSQVEGVGCMGLGSRV